MRDNFAFVQFMGICQLEEAASILASAHYHLMASKRYWYDAADISASTILCILASDLRKDARTI